MKTSYNLPQATLDMLAQLADRWSPERPNKTEALIRAVREAHRNEGLAEVAAPSRGAPAPKPKKKAKAKP